jgi:hypothetical protein
MPRKALAAALLKLTRLNEQLRLDPQHALELVADDVLLIHLEQRPTDEAQPRWLTPPMPPDRLLAVLDGMSLALDLDRGFAPSLPSFRPQA